MEEEEEEGALAQGLIAATVTVGIHTNSPHESLLGYVQTQRHLGPPLPNHKSP